MKFISLYNILLESRLDDYKLQLKDQQLANNIFSINNPKKEKMIIKWIKNGSIQYPEQKELIDKVYQIINIKQLDYNNYDSPQQILQKYQQLSNKLQYNPDNQKCFTNKVELGDGVVVYDVKDDMGGLMATRKAVDYNFGKDAKPWCLVTPPMYEAFKFWKIYSAIPKRICFQNGKLKAFCANDELKILWWDREDKETKNIPIKGVKDDPNAYTDVETIKNFYYNIERISSPSKLQKLYQVFKWNVILLYEFAANSNTPSKVLEDMQKNNDSQTLIKYILENPNCPKEILWKQLKKHPYLKDQIVKNINCPLDILYKLSDDESWQVKYYIANNPNTPNELLKKLFDENETPTSIRRSVLNNQNCPIELYYEIINNLTNDPNISEYTVAIAEKENCPVDILKELSGPKNLYRVRSAVIENPNTPIEIIKKLTKDPIQSISNLAKEILKTR